MLKHVSSEGSRGSNGRRRLEGQKWKQRSSSYNIMRRYEVLKFGIRHQRRNTWTPKGTWKWVERTSLGQI